MKKLFILVLSIASFALVSTSCTKSGCPMQITKELKFDKDVKVEAKSALFLKDLDCVN